MKRLRTSAPLAALALAWVGCVEVAGNGPANVDDVPTLGSAEPSPTGSRGGGGNGSSEPASPLAMDASDEAASPDTSPPDAGDDPDGTQDTGTDTDTGSSKKGDMRDGLVPL